MTTSLRDQGRRTKIIATLGPATDAILPALIEAGMDVARVNCSHGTVTDHLARIEAIRAAATAAGRYIAVFADLPGPKIRLAPRVEPLAVKTDDVVRLRTVDMPGDAADLTIHYPTLLRDVIDGDRVTLGDGALSFRVVNVTATHVVLLALDPGVVRGQPGIHLPAERVRVTTPTDEDLVIAEALAMHVDFLALSFVRSAEEVRRLRHHLVEHCKLGGAAPGIISKIETLGAVEALSDIVEASDAVMVARGDLGIECPLEDVPHLQKRIVRTCVKAGVPVITATQMLESMLTASTPTRAEVSDVANAVFDGADALMLSGETAIGVDPIGVIGWMARIAERAESEANYQGWGLSVVRSDRRDATREQQIGSSLAHAAWQAATDLNADAILCCTSTGGTANAVARYRPASRIIGMSPSDASCRRMTLTWGVTPLHLAWARSTDEMVWIAVEAATRDGIVHAGDVVAVLAGDPTTGDKVVDVLRLVRVR